MTIATIKNPYSVCFCLLLSLALMVANSTHLHAQGNATLNSAKFVPVLELFTSQGCSSCPAADKLLGQYVRRDDLIALSLHVDYWDYLSWKDTLARPEHAVRQRLYAKKAGLYRIMTPELVVNGVSHAMDGRVPEYVDEAIANARRRLQARFVDVQMTRNGNRLIIKSSAQQSTDTNASVWLASLSTAETVKITRGENRGRTMTYHNVVRDMKKLGNWSQGPLDLDVAWSEVMSKDADNCAILIQEGNGGPIIGAAMMKDVGS